MPLMTDPTKMSSKQIKELLDTRVRPLLLRMAATSPSTVLTAVWSICTCKGPAQAARRLR
jgi:hypothetical protein